MCRLIALALLSKVQLDKSNFAAFMMMSAVAMMGAESEKEAWRSEGPVSWAGPFPPSGYIANGGCWLLPGE